MFPNQLQHHLEQILPLHISVLIMGGPGLGKSEIVAQTAEAMEADLTDVRCQQLDAVDTRGLPDIDRDTNPDDPRTVWCPPVFWPSPQNRPRILFLDEIGHASPGVQAALLQLALNRRIGELVIPDNVSIVLASNRPEDHAGCGHVISSLVNRCSLVTLEPHVQSFLEHAKARNIDPLIIGFVRSNPDLLYVQPEKNQPHNTPTPRAYAMLDAALPSVTSFTDRTRQVECAASFIGPSTAEQFVQFSNIYLNYPDVTEIALLRPDDAALPTEPEHVWSVARAVLQAALDIGEADIDKASNALSYFSRLPEEIAISATKDLCAAIPAAKRTEGAGRINRTHGAAIRAITSGE